MFNMSRTLKSVKTVLGIGLLTSAFAFGFATTSNPVSAAGGTRVAQFYANCKDFSVDVDVLGVTNDSNGLDQFRYVISDGRGQPLYLENATRPVGTLIGHVVFNAHYLITYPSVNPITFQVIDLDIAGKPVKVLAQASYDALCLPASGRATQSGLFPAPESFNVSARVATPLYDGPKGQRISLSTAANQNWLGVYQSADSQWVGVYTDGAELAWLPSKDVSSNYALLPVKRGIIETNGQGNGITIRPLSDIHVRNAPSINAESIGRAPANVIFQVLGRSADGAWIQIVFNNGHGWIANAFACLMNGEVFNLPVVS